MVRNPVEQLGVEGLEELGALLPGRGSHPGCEFALHVIVMPESIRGAGGILQGEGRGIGN
jgi:hypothetical protein